MSYNANNSAKNFRISRNTPKGGESAIATLSRGLIRPDNHKVSHRVDAYGQLVEDSGYTGRTMYQDFNGLATTDQCPILTATGLVRATTTGLLHHLWTPQGNKFGIVNLGTQTLAPAIVAAGLDIGGDQTDDEGYEIFSHFAGATGSPFCIGKDPAFFFEAKFQVTDISGTDTLLVGFRRAEVHNLVLADYADYAGVGFNTSANPGAIKLIAEVNGSAPTSYPKDTTQTLADATAITVRVNVSAAGAITYRINGAAPTATQAATFDTGDPVIPFLHFLNSSDLADGVILHSWRTGYQ